MSGQWVVASGPVGVDGPQESVYPLLGNVRLLNGMLRRGEYRSKMDGHTTKKACHVVRITDASSQPESWVVSVIDPDLGYS
jgi:hypothetical protein